MSTTGRRFPIKVKLAAVLAVPVLGYLAVTSTAVVQAQQAADEIRDQASVVKTAVGPTSLTTSLIDERTIVALEGAGVQDELTLQVRDSDQARGNTDEQLSALQTLMEDNSPAEEAYKSAVDEVESALTTLRADIDAGQADDSAAFARYSELILSLMDANEGAVETLDDAEFWQGAKLSELATRQKDARALIINALVPIGLRDDGLSNQESQAIGHALGSYRNREAALSGLATGPYARAGSVLTEALEANDLAALAEEVLATGQLDPQQLYDTASYEGGFIYEAPTGDSIHDNFRALVVEVLDEEASQRSAAASRGLRIHILTGTVGLLLTGLITWLVSRSITRPLHALTEQAIDTATERLPATVQGILETPLGENVSWPQVQPIHVVSRDEVADVAQALNTMQDAAVRLAVEEAILRRHITDSLVTLGQRNQGLLSRQISFITDLERDETDPDTLANLFYLDHLATRMRRNAESLLVLAGIDPPRKWVGPTPVSDVIRAALGEAEEYKRVRVEDVAPATITGIAAAELSHLLAELIENALVFSPPNKGVEVKGRRHTADEGPSGSAYLVTVRDFGVGMSPSELDQANRRLAGEESYTIAPSKYMGHYVAGKLAARHGITVQLHNARSSGGGTIARIEIPVSVLTAEVPGSDATEHMPALPPLPEPEEGSPPVVPIEPVDPLPPIPPVPSTPATLATLADTPDHAGSHGPTDEPELDPDRVNAPPAEVYHLPPRMDPSVHEAATQPDHAPVDLPPPVPLSNAGSGQKGPKSSSGTMPNKPRKRKKRSPLAANKLPVPPSNPPLEASSDSD